MTFKKFALVFCMLCAVIICSCGDRTEYTFINKSSYIIHITLSESYREINSTDSPYVKYPFKVYVKDMKTVYIQKSDVDFSWTTSYAGDNSKVYCEINGSKATFKNQEE